VSLANEKDVLRLQQLGKQYAEDALKFFGEKYSQKPEIREVAIFYATATAAMAETMYAFLSANAEKEQADGWLIQLFGMIGKSLQTKRIPMPPTLNPAAGEMSASAEEMPAPASKRVIPKCICTVDASGVCPACPGNIKVAVRKVLIPVGDCLRVVENGVRKIGMEHSCEACIEAYLDAAVASIIMEGSLGELSPDLEPFAEQIFEAIYQWAVGRGVSDMTLSEKAWAIFADRMADEDDPTVPEKPVS
jgi:hypothetical protein